MCGEENAARQIVDLEGIERLAQLVRDPRERNYSDGVLVACLVIINRLLIYLIDQIGQTDFIFGGLFRLLCIK